ncbi:MAG: c-type cytochrome domain-containing protein [Gemmataceae bacterium]
MIRTLSLLLPAALVAALVSSGPAPYAALAAEPNPVAAAPVPVPTGKLEYNRDIRPILAENCFACHGADSAARKAGLRIDQRDAAIEAKAIEPGKPEKSSIIERIFTAEAKEMMPPPKSHKKLTAAPEGDLEALGGRGRGVSAALVVHRAGPAQGA